MRLAERKTDPLKRWKNSPIDAVAAKKWKAYSKARDEMLRRTSIAEAPWRIVKADDKKSARLALFADLLNSFSYKGKDKKVLKLLPDLVFPWSPKHQGQLAP